VLHQVPAPNLEAFKAAYCTLLDIIQGYVGHRLVICTCSVIGEDISSPTNRTTSRVNDLIRGLAEVRRLELADVWAAFSQELAERTPGRPASFPMPGGWQYMKGRLRSLLAPPRKVNPRQSLHLTLDGVHPNPRGAELWAHAVWRALSTAACQLGV
jgi:lysophospholipase L1-like esterase